MNVTLKVSFEEAFHGVEKRVTVRIPGKSESDTVTVKVPAGAVDGGRLRFRGKGGLSRNGSEPGDLLVTTKIEPHPYYRREKADVVVDMPGDRRRGGARRGGRRARARRDQGARARSRGGPKTAPCSPSRARARPTSGARGSFGNLKIQVDVKVPKDMNEKQRKAMEDFLAATTEDVRTWE